ncbi:uncharacterized protein LOC123561763 [Mercenaria mercenaria]|uniref:uncharacterized protein LOC123561763 n=1 Tax=Mercenaria mercenaria TaxID=6596 RepID=UPI00234E7A25|nr:uncharacterized protein LOC123561763 [Mercenaria mercenaria]
MAAPSLYLRYNDGERGDILTQDVYVPKFGLTKYTYYCCLQWNAGMNGGGYCGIQDHPKGRNYIFSLWDPVGTDKKIKPIYVGPGTIYEPFGGEGQGLKTWNFTLGWESDSWYTVVIRRWDDGENTCYGFWVKHQMTLEWTHIVSLEFPVTATFFETMSCSFLEYWVGTGDQKRCVHYKNGYKHGLNGKWMPFNKAVFSMVGEMRCKLFENNYDSGVLHDAFYLHSGGQTMQSASAVNGGMLTREMPAKPDVLPICVYLSSVTSEEVSWEISSGSVPQFQYIVYIDKLIYKHEVNSEARTCKFDTPPTELVELLIEDIYGHAVRSKFKITNPPDCDQETRTRLEVYVPTATH